jgi:hypothetical protein
MPTALEDIIKLKKEVSTRLAKVDRVVAPEAGRIREGEGAASAEERSDAVAAD